MLNELLSPVAIYIVLAACTLFFLVLFLLISLNARRKFKECAVAMDEVRREIESLREQVRSATVTRTEEPIEPVEAPSPAVAASGMSINLTRRAQVLRMHRSGVDAAEIARRLSLPRGEVNLTLKMHRLLLDQRIA